MKIYQIFSLIIALLIMASCEDTDKNLIFQDSDKERLILQENMLSKEYLKTVDFKNHIYSKSFDSITNETTYEYESELRKSNKIIGGFAASTYLYPISDLNDMEQYFLSYIAGHNFEELISPNFRYERNIELKLPFKKYRIYNVYKNDTLNIGITFNILNENKIIFASFVSAEEYELNIEKLIDKVSGI